jgi:hypothetical protein
MVKIEDEDVGRGEEREALLTADASFPRATPCCRCGAAVWLAGGKRQPRLALAAVLPCGAVLGSRHPPLAGRE